jgi:hypothetical protein
VESDRLGDSVALVENAEDRDALRHRRHSGLAHLGRARGIARRLVLRRLLLLPPPAPGERKRKQQWCDGLVHAYSGIQGS